MKHTKLTLLALTFLILVFMFSSYSYGFISVSTPCPDEFVGVVTDVVHPKTSISSQASSLLKIEVSFSVTKKLKGEVEDVETFKMLSRINQNFVEGESYRVALRNRYLCSVTKLNL